MTHVNLLRHPARGCTRPPSSEQLASHCHFGRDGWRPYAPLAFHGNCRYALCLGILLFFLTFARAAVVTSYVATSYSYQLCSADMMCASAFHLPLPVLDSIPLIEQQTARTRFEEMLPVALARQMSGSDNVVAMVEMCAEGANATDVCSVVQQMWLGNLRQLSVCDGANEVWQVGHGCVCEHGKHCDDDNIGVSISDLWSYNVGWAVVGLAMVVNFVWQSRHLKSLWHFIDQLRSEYSEMISQNQAALWLYNGFDRSYAPFSAAKTSYIV